MRLTIKASESLLGVLCKRYPNLVVETRVLQISVGGNTYRVCRASDLRSHNGKLITVMALVV